ncbi:MAG: DUF1853 family protein [Flavobacteriaceae bacterium]|nr:DUF1853 family protein [Flavobacteriaceae bacterium]
MALTTKQIQQHFDGFLQTPSLWENNAVFDLQQFQIEQKPLQISIEINPKLRLGKYIERFVSFQISENENCKIISENIQIQKDKVTLGELDCLLYKNKKPIHLEVIYKFYVYDEKVGTTEIDHFIGPNRKDSLTEKLNKLQHKQLPLLYSNECKLYLSNLDLDVLNIEQQVYFKAQLFVPFAKKDLQLTLLNPECICGFYINQQELQQFSDCKFYMPSKKDWLTMPHIHVDWLNFNAFKTKVNTYLERQFSPMVWVKHPSGNIEKLFVVWWHA